MGDLNIDLIKHDTHQPTSDFLYLKHTLSMIPLIRKPTRVTAQTASLIDHFFTNDLFDAFNHPRSILCATFTDHYGVVHISEGNLKSSQENEYVTKRRMNQSDINMFVDCIRHTNWSSVTQHSNEQSACNSFREILSEIYNSCFPWSSKKRYHNRKPWLADGLKNYINPKNKLYVKSLKQRHNGDLQKEYVKHRNNLNHLLRIAERKHYNDLLD